MTKHTLAYNVSLFQELDSKLQNLDSLLFQASIASSHIREIWREIVML